MKQKESLLSDEIAERLFNHYENFMKTNSNIELISKSLKSLQGQLAQYGVSIEKLRQKLNDMATVNQNNEWQNYINQGLDENWEIDDSEEPDVLKHMGTYGKYLLHISIFDRSAICQKHIKNG